MALSITEAEYIAATSTACQIVWFRRILQEAGVLINEATPLGCDNQSAIAVAKNPVHHGRTKHIDVRYHFIRSLVTDNVISLHHCSSDRQLADILTKPLSPEKHSIMRGLIGMRTLHSRGGVGDMTEDARLTKGKEKLR